MRKPFRDLLSSYHTSINQSTSLSAPTRGIAHLRPAVLNNGAEPNSQADRLVSPSPWGEGGGINQRARTVSVRFRERPRRGIGSPRAVAIQSPSMRRAYDVTPDFILLGCMLSSRWCRPWYRSSVLSFFHPATNEDFREKHLKSASAPVNSQNCRQKDIIESQIKFSTSLRMFCIEYHPLLRRNSTATDEVALISEDNTSYSTSTLMNDSSETSQSTLYHLDKDTDKLILKLLTSTMFSIWFSKEYNTEAWSFSMSWDYI